MLKHSKLRAIIRNLLILMGIILCISFGFYFFSSLYKNSRTVEIPQSTIRLSFTHDQIIINGNDDFTAENGVLNASALGSKDDPYIIESWVIDAGMTESSGCIYVNNTDKYFIIRNCTLKNAGINTSSIYLRNVSNGAIISNRIINNGGIGLSVCNSDSLFINANNISNNRKQGLLLKHNTKNNLITKNDIMFNDIGIKIQGNCNNHTLLDNHLIGNNKSIWIGTQSNLTNIVNNYILNSKEYGIFINGTNCCITGNRLNNCGDFGILINCNHNLIYNNSLVNIEGYYGYDNGTNNEWDNGLLGNFWENYEDRYPNIWNDGLYYGTPYEINGTANSCDTRPVDNIFAEEPKYFDTGIPPDVYSEIGVYTFNCTWYAGIQLAEVYLKFNNTYHHVIQNHSGEFSYSFYDLPANKAGYPYQWLAKNEENAWNASIEQSFILTKAKENLTLLFNGTDGDCTHYTHRDVNITLINKDQVSGDLLLYINKTLVQESSQIISNISKYSNQGIYNITGVLLHENYTGRITSWMNIQDVIAPHLEFELSENFISTITPQYNETELEINCKAVDDSPITWLYICENSTGRFINHSMTRLFENYTFILNISSLRWGNSVSFSFYASDSEGNTVFDNNNGYNYTIHINDFISPHTSLIYQSVEAPNYVSNTTEFTLLTTDFDIRASGIHTTWYRIDSGLWKQYFQPFSLMGYDEGLHTIYFFSMDNANNSGSERNLQVYLDINPIELTLKFTLIHQPNYVDEDTVIKLIPIECLGSSIKYLKYKIDSGSWNNRSQFKLSDFPLGQHTIQYWIEDHAGNYMKGFKEVFLVTMDSDLDNDGLIYSREGIYKTNPFLKDTDNDRLLDGEEVDIYRTSPLLSDTDGDGYSDFEECIIFNTNPNSPFSSPKMTFIAIMTIILTSIAIISTISTISLKKGRGIRQKSVEGRIIKKITDGKIRILDYKQLNRDLTAVRSELTFRKLIKAHNICGKYLHSLDIFIKEGGLEEILNEISTYLNIANRISCNTQKKSKAIKLKLSILEQEIRKYRGEEMEKSENSKKEIREDEGLNLKSLKSLIEQIKSHEKKI